MQCPNCKMNVKDDASFCMYCGTQFQNQATNIVSNNTVANANVVSSSSINSKKNQTSITKIVITIVIVIVVGYSILAFLTKGNIASKSIEVVGKDEMLDINHEYTIKTVNAFKNGELRVYDGSELADGSYYYVSIDGSNDDELLYPIKIDIEDKSDRGYVFFQYNTNSNFEYYSCLSREINEKKVYISSYDGDKLIDAFSLKRSNVTYTGDCEPGQDFYKRFSPNLLVKADINE